jgi:ABC-type oligopeptide transport system ATPase subunit
MLVCGRTGMSLLQINDVTKTFQRRFSLSRTEPTPAVKDVNLSVEPGETLGIVGESGSGKSTLLRLALRLLEPTKGKILFRNREIAALRGPDLLQFRREVQAIFQDPASSFNPRQRISAVLSAPLEVHGIGNRITRGIRIAEVLDLVGLPESFVSRFPHQLSGGQRQRVAIARAIILGPSLVLADEPTSALDVSVQAQILNLLRDTKLKLGLTTIFVSHNLAVIRFLSDRVAVMRHGEIVEAGLSEDVFSNPKHPYTKALMDAVPDPRRRIAKAQGAAHA